MPYEIPPVDDADPFDVINDGKEYVEWQDMVGNSYGPGALIAYASGYGSNGSKMTVGRVIRINRVNSEGRRHGRAPYQYSTNPDAQFQASCSVTVQPLVDSQSRRWSSNKDTGLPRPVTLGPTNILRVEEQPMTLEHVGVEV